MSFPIANAFSTEEQANARDTTSLTDLDQRIFDRSNTTNKLVEAYRTSSDTRTLVLVSGKVGSGKTTVAKTLSRAVEQDGGYFCSGHFDRMNQHDPYSALVPALTDFAAQVVARKEVNDIQQTLMVGDFTVLTNMAPALKQIVGTPPQEPAPRSDSYSGQHLDTVIRSFLSAIASAERPLVVLFDDLDHADAYSLRLFENLVAGVESKHVLFLCTCSNELDSSNSVCQVLRKLEEEQVRVTHVKVSGLSIDTVRDTMMHLLNTSETRSQHLAETIVSKTSGNALLVGECIRMLYTKELLFYDSNLKQWTWKEEDVRLALDNTCEHSILNSSLEQTSEQQQELLRVASCLGSRLDEEVLSRAMSAPVAQHLEECVKRKLLTPEKKGLYAFANGFIHEVFYSQVQRHPEFHLAIGRRLLKNFTADELESHVFVVLNQLRRGEALITSQDERSALARLSLMAAKKKP